MSYKRNFFFYQCYNCGQWYYSEKVIKVKKCVRCNRLFQFQKSPKFSKCCLTSEAIEIIKNLKKAEERESQIKLENIKEFTIKNGSF
ncbi:MAG TPA: DUF1922 domain-containing protein [Candidatus Lokiarchaeia archaeon]